MRQSHKGNLILRIVTASALLLLIPLCLWLGARQRSAGEVALSELMAVNSAFPDENGGYPDFIELHNAGTGAVDLGGWGLTDSTRTVKYRFPKGTVLDAEGYLVVWCDAASSDDAVAPFSLAREGGETVSLLNAHGTVVSRVETLAMGRGVSMIADGAGRWSLCDAPSPGYANTPEGHRAALSAKTAEGTVQISEFMSDNSLHPAPDGEYYDWIELHNTGDAEVDLGGWRLSDTDAREKYLVPAGTVIPAEGYLVLWCGAGGAGFSLKRMGGEKLCLADGTGQLLDSVETPALDKNRSCARTDDGAWTVSAQPTPGWPNTEDGWNAYLTALGYAGADVSISELMADNQCCLPDASGAFSDWLELYNGGETDLDLSGWWLSDDPERPDKWRIPALTVPANGFALIRCDGLDCVTDGECHAGFSLSAAGETVTLSNPLAVPVSSLTYGTLGTDRSAVNLGGADAPSPGFPNTPEGVLAFLDSRETPSPLAINEVMSANDRYLRQWGDKFYDWVEIKNVSDEDVELEGWGLSDSLDDLGRYVFPAQTLAPGEVTVVLLCGGADEYYVRYVGQPHADFALNAAEDRLYLSDPAGAIRDFVGFGSLPYGCSYGRMDGARGFYVFDTPTPEAQNGTGSRTISPTPAAEAAPGVYDAVESVRVALSGAAVIRYTLDGSVPTEGSPLYETPFELTKTTVIRARSFDPGCVPGETATLNYIINEGHVLPVVCLSMAPTDFDGPFGVYSLTQRHGYEVRANVSLFEQEGGGFSRDCGARLHGAGSRTNYAKKTFRVNFRPSYGGHLDYDVFGDGQYTDQAALLLRGGSLGNGNVLLKDSFIAMVAQNCGCAALYLRARYCVLYVNARYWGIYSLRDAYSETYVAERLGGREDAVSIVQGPLIDRTGKEDLYDNMQNVSRALDPETGYAWAASWLDLDSLIDWTILEAYFANMDIPGNVRYVKGGLDGRWRYGLFDLDEGLYSNEGTWSEVFSNGMQHAKISRTLIRNPQYQELFLSRFSALLAGPLSDEAVCEVLEGIVAQLDPEIEREAKRWGSRSAWEGTTQRLLTAFRGGWAEHMAKDLAKRLSLSDADYAEYFPFFSET